MSALIEIFGTMDNDSKITINDVAIAAGVSKGTVDRVLHNRGEVSRKSREKVLKVIEELGYKPNLYASVLASRKLQKIICIIPEFAPGEFWELTARGIASGKEKSSAFGVSVQTIQYDQYDVESFSNACERALQEKPSGVILAPMFRVETLKFVSRLKEHGIYYMYIDSRLDDDGYLGYFGMPMYQSGYLCADMLTWGHPVKKVHVIRIARDKKGLSDPTVSRRVGFMDYMAENYPDCMVENVFINPKDPDDIRMKMDRLFEQDSDPVKYLTMFNSRIHLVASYLKERDVHSCRVVGFDVLEKNLEAMREGYVQVLIAQHSDLQAESAITAMADWLLIGKPLPKKDNYTQMDILNRYNCDYYL